MIRVKIRIILLKLTENQTYDLDVFTAILGIGAIKSPGLIIHVTPITSSQVSYNSVKIR